MLWSETDLSIWIKQTTQQDAKLNNAAQDDGQHNTTLTHKKNLIYVKITYLDRKREEKKWYRWNILCKNDLKPPLLDEWKRKRNYPWLWNISHQMSKLKWC